MPVMLPFSGWPRLVFGIVTYVRWRTEWAHLEYYDDVN